MLLLRAIFSLFETRKPIRADLPPPPRMNRTRDLVYGLIIGSAILCGFFWLLYLEVTNPTQEGKAADERRARAARMADVDSRPVSVSLTFFEDASATASPAAPAAETILRDPVVTRPEVPRRLELFAPPSETISRPQVELAPPPTLGVELPILTPEAPSALKDPVPGP